MGEAAALEEHWITFSNTLQMSLALVVDCSESAAAFWDAIWRQALALRDRLPGGTTYRVYFLGNPRAHTFEELQNRLRDKLRTNRGRPSLIGPVFRSLSHDRETLVAVLGAGKILDLEDWTGSPIFRQTWFLRFGAEPLTGDPARETTNSDEVMRKLRRTTVGVRLSGKGLMPFQWDNCSYVWNGASLAAEHARDYNLRVGLLVPRGGTITVERRLDNGACEPIPWQPIEPAHEGGWRELTTSESEILAQVIDDGNYQCPYCAGRHDQGILRCLRGPRTSIVGQIVYSQIEALDQHARGFVLLQKLPHGGQWRLHKCNVLRLGQDTVAVASWSEGKASRAQVLWFDPALCQWRAKPGEAWREHYPLAGQTYAILP